MVTVTRPGQGEVVLSNGRIKQRVTGLKLMSSTNHTCPTSFYIVCARCVDKITDHRHVLETCHLTRMTLEAWDGYTDNQGMLTDELRGSIPLQATITN